MLNTELNFTSSSFIERFKKSFPEKFDYNDCQTFTYSGVSICDKNSDNYLYTRNYDYGSQLLPYGDSYHLFCNNIKFLMISIRNWRK